MCVERGQRLVEQEHARVAGQRACEADPLPLAARKRLRLGAGELRDAEPLQQVPDAVAPGVADVLLHRHVREQRVVLEHEADAAALGRDVDPRVGVEQHCAVELDPPAVGSGQAGDRAQDGRLARP